MNLNFIKRNLKMKKNDCFKDTEINENSAKRKYHIFSHFINAVQHHLESIVKKSNI